MTHRQRFGVWVVTVVVALAAPIWLHIDIAHAPFVAAVTSLAGLSVLLLLLATTPANAIRLPLWASAAAIGLGTLAIALIAGTPLPAAAGVGLIGVLMSLLSRVRVFRCEPHSPWIYTLMLWHPALWLTPTVRPNFPDAADWLWAALLALCAGLGVLVRSASRGRITPTGAVIIGVAWQVAGGAALWMAWRSQH